MRFDRVREIKVTIIMKMNEDTRYIVMTILGNINKELCSM